MLKCPTDEDTVEIICRLSTFSVINRSVVPTLGCSRERAAPRTSEDGWGEARCVQGAGPGCPLELEDAASCGGSTISSQEPQTPRQEDGSFQANLGSLVKLCLRLRSVMCAGGVMQCLRGFWGLRSMVESLPTIPKGGTVAVAQ